MLDIRKISRGINLQVTGRSSAVWFSATRRSQNWFPTDITYEYLGVKKVVAEQPNDEDDDDIPF